MVEKANTAERIEAIKESDSSSWFPCFRYQVVSIQVLADANEAASFAVLYAIIVGCIFYRKLGVDITRAALNTGDYRGCLCAGGCWSGVLMVHLVWTILSRLLAPLNLKTFSRVHLFVIALTFFVSFACSWIHWWCCLSWRPSSRLLMQQASTQSWSGDGNATNGDWVGNASIRLWHLHRDCDFRASLIWSHPRNIAVFLILILMSALLIFFPSIALLPETFLFN